jgi:hypothetical protein
MTEESLKVFDKLNTPNVAVDDASLISEFNNVLVKSDMLRRLNTDELIDLTLNKMRERLELYGDEFSHKDLTDYLKAFVAAQQKQQSNQNSVNLTQINLNSANTHTSNSNEPVILKTSEAQVKGVIVVSSGANDPAVKELLYDAVKTSLQISGHQVEIYAK